MNNDLIVQKTECRKSFEHFASSLGFDTTWGDNVYADKETHLIWIGYRQAYNNERKAA